MTWLDVKLLANVRLELPGGAIEVGQVFELDEADLRAGVRPDLWIRSGAASVVTAKEEAVEPIGEEGVSDPPPSETVTAPAKRAKGAANG